MTRPHGGTDSKSAPVRLLLADLDNTLYDWVDYFAPAFRAMVHVLAERLHVPEEELTLQFGRIYEEMGTTEYPFTVQSLPVVQNYPMEERSDLVELALKVFGASRRKRLRPYPGVRDTLRWLRQTGVDIAIVTSAPTYVVAPKLNQLGVLPYTSLIVAWEGFSVPDDEISQRKRSRSPVRQRANTLSLPRSSFRPKTDAFLAAMQLLKVPPSQCAIVGDSLATDVLPATELGVLTFWARYGLEFGVQNRKTIEAITPGGQVAVAQAYALTPVPNDAAELKDFADLRRLLTTPQPSLF